MSRSVARRVAVEGALILLGALIVVGAGTGLVLHQRAVRAQDQALLAAALGRAHPPVHEAVEVEHVLPMRVWLVADDDRRISRGIQRQARRADTPLLIDLDADRVAIVAFEVEHDGSETRGLAAAASRRVTLSQSLGAFGLVYSAIAAAAATIALLVHRRAVRRAFAPLERTRDEVARVLGLGDAVRLTEDGPTEVRSLVVAVNALLDRLAASHDAQSRFTAEAAHELRTPVTTMLGELDVALRADRTGAEYQATLSSVREEVARLRRIVEGLTALAQIDAGQIDRDRERLRAGELASAAVSHESATLAAAGCSVVVQLDADPELDGHRALLEIALSNLLRNAARHAPGTAVTLRVGCERALVTFEVDDGGPGVPETERAALLGRFTRGPDARTRDRGGLGLGLPLAREVARRHGGDCTLGASPAGGLRARLSALALPIS